MHEGDPEALDVPAEQVLQPDDMGEEYWPASHASQDVAPDEEYLPPSQTVQEPASGREEYLPGVHRIQCDADRFENLPAHRAITATGGERHGLRPRADQRCTCAVLTCLCTQTCDLTHLVAHEAQRDEYKINALMNERHACCCCC